MKRKASTAELELEQDAHKIEIMPLGAGQEVGRSCIILKYAGKTVMLDCGIHPGYSGETCLPFFDSTEMEEIDVMLVTHFHLDHCAAVPYVTSKTPFKGRIFMTHPTKAICGTLLKDFIKLSGGKDGEPLYKAVDLTNALEKSEVLDFHQTVDINGIKVTAYKAGHVLGAAMFMVEIAGLRVLYTGDYSRLPDRHLPGAETPPEPPHILIVEATYGISRHEARHEREERFKRKIRDTVLGGGSVLLPIVALGRAQELLLILEELWRSEPALREIPIYQTSGLAQRALSVYQTYVEMMNADIKAAFQIREQASNPFMFKHIVETQKKDDLEGSGPRVILATPSMLQNGLSRKIFEEYAPDPKNTIIIADFAVQGTLAKEVLGNPTDFMTLDGKKKPLRATVEPISFSAHADYTQTSGFVEDLAPADVILVHGEHKEMERLRTNLVTLGKEKSKIWTVHTPKITKTVTLYRKPLYAAKVVGQMADKPLRNGATLQGVLVQQGSETSIMAAADLAKFTKLKPGRIRQRMPMPLSIPFSQARLALEVVFEGVEGAEDIGKVEDAGSPREQALRVCDVVKITYKPGQEDQMAHVVLEWEGMAAADLVADAIIAVLLQASEEPIELSVAEKARQQALDSGDTKAAADAEMQIVVALLRSQFGPADVDHEAAIIFLRVDERMVVINMKTRAVDCPDASLRDRVELALDRLMTAMRPCLL